MEVRAQVEHSCNFGAVFGHVFRAPSGFHPSRPGPNNLPIFESPRNSGLHLQSPTRRRRQPKLPRKLHHRIGRRIHGARQRRLLHITAGSLQKSPNSLKCTGPFTSVLDACHRFTRTVPSASVSTHNFSCRFNSRFRSRLTSEYQWYGQGEALGGS